VSDDWRDPYNGGSPFPFPTTDGEENEKLRAENEKLRNALKEALAIADDRLMEAASCDAFHVPPDQQHERIAELRKEFGLE
jgi:regulator of replication initiation timing